MRKRTLVLVLVVASLIALPACAEPEPQTVEVTREVEVLQTVEVTREVTRIVERVVQETVEVTRVEQIVVTATPTPTPINTPTPSSTPTTMPVPTADVASRLLRAMRSTRKDLEELGGLIDDAVRTGVFYAQRNVDLHTSIVNAPVFDTSGGNDVLKWANDRYREAIQVYSEGGSGLAEQSNNWLAGEGKDRIARVTWTRARKAVSDALAVLIPAIEKLE
jgi:hypothetical protein